MPFLSYTPFVPTDMLHLDYTLEIIVFIVAEIFAPTTSPHMLNHFEHSAILCLKPVSDFQIVNELMSRFLVIVPVKRFKQRGVCTCTRCWVMQVREQSFLYVLRKKAFSEEGYHNMAELCFPLFTVRRCIVFKVNKYLEMCYLM